MHLALIAWIAVGLIALIAMGAAYQRIGLRRDARNWTPPGRMVQIGGGRRIHIYALGQGAPAVIFESGIAATSLNWRSVQEKVGERTLAVAYDRRGLGWSDPCSPPLATSGIAAELHTALHAASIEPPYVLVGHSFGGLVVRRFASLYPADVAGLVLVDAVQPQEWSSPLPEDRRRMLRFGVRLARRGAFLARIGIVRLAVRLAMAGSRWLPKAIGKITSGEGAGVINRIAGEVGKMPRELWPMVAAHWCNPASFLGMAAHFEALPASADEVLAAGPIDGIPVTVITAGKNEPVDSDTVRNDAIRAIARGARHVVAHESGHWIHLDEPALVVREILAIVEMARPPAQ
jgi:pimeloyl-ACP methyl ester carboxylesterase